jgi:hypothetical protein
LMINFIDLLHRREFYFMNIPWQVRNSNSHKQGLLSHMIEEDREEQYHYYKGRILK